MQTNHPTHKSLTSQLADIGLIGIGKMGGNLALNMADNGFFVAVQDADVRKAENLAAASISIRSARNLTALVAALKRPRRLLVMVKAGPTVDAVIAELVPLLDPGDIIIDGGNSLFTDTNRRVNYLESKGLLFIGTGISGGKEGARHGPSLMPGGSRLAWTHVRPVFQAIAAKVPDPATGVMAPCCDWVGEGGAGHFVKMVHNGIEYGDMQLICEIYQIMKDGLGMMADEMSAVFAEWNQGDLESYLIEITRDILAKKDSDGAPLVEKILDVADQQGTGQWTLVTSSELGTPITLIAESVCARSLSTLLDQRLAVASQYPLEVKPFPSDHDWCSKLRKALYASKIISYAQGFMLMHAASAEYGWSLNLGGIALMWRGGCIIRSAFLGEIKKAIDTSPNLPNLLLSPFFRDALMECSSSLREVVAAALGHGIPTPALASAIGFLDAMRSARLPANLLQALRNCFGGHEYERIDAPRGQRFDTDWRR